MHSRRTWVLWLIGFALVGWILRYDPALAVYLMDPEFVASWVLFLVYYVFRRTPGQVANSIRRTAAALDWEWRYYRACIRMKLRWENVTADWRVGTAV